MIIKKLITIFLLLFLSACSSKSNEDFDFSNFKPPNKKSKLAKDNSKVTLEMEVENKLLPLKKRNEISSSIEYGKKDPFSLLDNESNEFISNLKLKGFISLNNKNYAFIEFQNLKGFININSVGGLNTKLLPKKVFVKEIIPSQEQISLSLEGEIFTLELR
tara:strand:- start:55 stop:537 length:483 start_codon:yes stop_codon:yes gene_type:complete